MKKIFTLLVSACVAASAMAMPVKQVYSTKTDLPDAATVARTAFQGNMKDITLKDAPDGMYRAMTSGTGENWSMLFRLMGPAGEIFGLVPNQSATEPISLEEFPYHAVILASQHTQSDFFPAYMLWPSRAALDDEVLTQNGIDKDKCIAKYGSLEAALAPASIEAALADNNRIPVLAGFYGVTSIIQSDFLRAPVRWHGTEYATKPCSVGQTQINLDGSYVDWTSYDPDLMEAELTFNWILGTSNGQGGVTGSTINAVYALSGTPCILGFTDLILDFNEVHAFNCGLTDIFSEYGIAYMNDVIEDFTPVKRYYLAWCDASVSYMGRTQSGSDVFGWSKEVDGKEVLEDGLLQNIAPVAATVENYVMTFLNVALYVPENASDFNGVYAMATPEYTTKIEGGQTVLDQWLSVPTPYNLVPDYYNAAPCDQDGFQCCWNGYPVSPEEGLTLLGAGDENYGFNFKFTAQGWSGHTVMGYSTEPIYLHNNANNWDQFSQVPAVSTGVNNNVLDRDFGGAGVEEVVSNAPVVSTQYFNLQGQRLNMAPERGIYIQREIKADGTVKASKVVK